MPGDWFLPPVPGYVTFELPGFDAALEAFHKAEDEADAAGYHVSTNWRSSHGEADMVVLGTDAELRQWNEATSARDCPRPMFALRWVWPASDKIGQNRTAARDDEGQTK